jgi:hypothetical protein
MNHQKQIWQKRSKEKRYHIFTHHGLVGWFVTTSMEDTTFIKGIPRVKEVAVRHGWHLAALYQSATAASVLTLLTR